MEHSRELTRRQNSVLWLATNILEEQLGLVTDKVAFFDVVYFTAFNFCEADEETYQHEVNQAYEIAVRGSMQAHVAQMLSVLTENFENDPDLFKFHSFYNGDQLSWQGCDVEYQYERLISLITALLPLSSYHDLNAILSAMALFLVLTDTNIGIINEWEIHYKKYHNDS